MSKAHNLARICAHILTALTIECRWIPSCPWTAHVVRVPQERKPKGSLWTKRPITLSFCYSQRNLVSNIKNKRLLYEFYAWHSNKVYDCIMMLQGGMMKHWRFRSGATGWFWTTINLLAHQGSLIFWKKCWRNEISLNESICNLCLDNLCLNSPKFYDIDYIKNQNLKKKIIFYHMFINKRVNIHIYQKSHL